MFTVQTVFCAQDIIQRENQGVVDAEANTPMLRLAAKSVDAVLRRKTLKPVLNATIFPAQNSKE